MAFTNRSMALAVLALRPVTVVLVGMAVSGHGHANTDVVEGVAVSGSETTRVDLGYRCKGQDCGFEAILHGVLPADVVEYEWQFGDGETLTTTIPVVDYRWAEPGSWNVSLLVHDQYCDPLLAESTLSILATDPVVNIEPLAAGSVRLAQDPTRIVSEPLQGTTVGGDVFVFLEASELAESVTFRLLDESLDTRALQVENGAPFDMAGGSLGAASPFDTRVLANGAYRLDVSVIYLGGTREDAVSVTFEVRNTVDEPLAEGPTGGDGGEPTVGGATPDGEPTDGGGSTGGDSGETPVDGGEAPTGGTTPDGPEAPVGEGPDTTPTDGGDSTGGDSGETPVDGGESPTGGTTPDGPEAPVEEGPDTTPTDGDGSTGGDAGETPVDGGESPTGGTTPDQPEAPVEEGPDTTPTDGGSTGGDSGETPADGGESPTDGDVTEGGDGEPPANEPPTVEPDPVVVEPTGTLVFSTRADRSGARPLAGATVGRKTYLHLEGSAGVSSVRFFVDDPTLSGQPLSVDTSAPWDVMGGSDRRAKALDTRRLGRGRHVLSAKVVESGLTYTVHASFTVGR